MQLSKSSGHCGHLRLSLGFNGTSFEILKNDVDRFAEGMFYICDLCLPLCSWEHTCELGGTPGAGRTRSGGEAAGSPQQPVPLCAQLVTWGLMNSLSDINVCLFDCSCIKFLSPCCLFTSEVLFASHRVHSQALIAPSAKDPCSSELGLVSTTCSPVRIPLVPRLPCGGLVLGWLCYGIYSSLVPGRLWVT